MHKKPKLVYGSYLIKSKRVNLDFLCQWNMDGSALKMAKSLLSAQSVAACFSDEHSTLQALEP